MVTIERAIEKPKDKRFKDLTGKRFTHLNVVSYAGKWGKLKTKSHYWYCKCDCGRYRLVTTSNLKSESIKSCGCKVVELTDLTLMRFGRLTVIQEVERSSEKRVWLCRCDCGEEKIVQMSNLTTGHTQSCGCLQREQVSKSRFQDLTGLNFGRLKVIERHGSGFPTKWLTACECGKKTVVAATHLQTGHTKSCGCLSSEKSRERFSKWVGLKGKDSMSYKPEITDEEREKGRFLYRDKLTVWRSKVFKRDKYTCQICLKTGGYLHAHHLDGYHWCREKRFDEGNGVTLCEGCHRDFHREYGTRNNTREQFDEFMTAIKGGDNE